MTNAELQDAWRVITTANVADACVRLGASFSIGPTIVKPLFAGARYAGRTLPVTQDQTRENLKVHMLPTSPVV